MTAQQSASADQRAWNKPLWFNAIGTLAAIGIVGTLLLSGGREKSVAALAADLQSPDNHTRHLAAKRLAKLSAQAKDVVPQLTEALKDPDVTVRHYVAKTLAEIGIDAKPATGALIANLDDPDPDTRYYVVKALSKVELDKSHGIAVPGLVRDLKDPNPKIRYYAAKCLKCIGPAASAAIPALREAVNDSDKDVKETAATALKKVTKAG